VLLGPAPANHQLLPLLQLDELLQGLLAITAGGPDETAGVEHPDVGVFELVDGLDTSQGETAQKGLGVHQVLVATEGGAEYPGKGV
jgi:hypothetical protein